MRRTRTTELMDRLDADRQELRRSLRDLEQVNLWLGGYRSAVSLVLRLAREVRKTPVRILDVGTGGAGIPLKLAAAARKEGLPVKILATDLHPETVEFARRATESDPDVEVTAADAMKLPFEDGAFDLAVCSTTLHHFDRRDAVQVLRELDRVSRDGIIVTDLARSAPALLGARMLAATVWRSHPITRHDAPASVRAAFTVDEMREMAEEAVRGRIEVRREPIFRLALIADRTAGGG